MTWPNIGDQVLERRTFMALVVGGLVATPLAAVTAQPREKVSNGRFPF